VRRCQHRADDRLRPFAGQDERRRHPANDDLQYLPATMVRFVHRDPRRLRIQAAATLACAPLAGRRLPPNRFDSSLPSTALVTVWLRKGHKVWRLCEPASRDWFGTRSPRDPAVMRVRPGLVQGRGTTRRC
jgi:hypothetical protein